ncbi:cyclohexanecarboxylate-CoA ligase [Acinetobacter baumannii]|uniref:cyclohexanecarboxylate-CoA ligase n=1 Tax=Acinetobacter baumannii TaxID=470 RepID=UPI001C0D0BB9|nr:cyclohexanecarboxylate-CoA ligase [Acinetobacter baumannii]EKV3807256.1 cyclohexanecarboxylate-CoA ligase [Acinetobacter baumannii]EKW1173509.1 cyclohexanecarboxylate-CoA ligase [Acinetobacter baumannii]MBU3815737.1 cyclohexanecarboxylate-CoA ligase [Acinetobacter baumannii]HAV6134969.1 cyclohexanecarboxylate-CoA ligase [Acinetobacter baumannii]HCQ9872320.1 cyclohexanecarboxylate-CoA ligase [Acinetobacter baumannii]
MDFDAVLLPQRRARMIQQGYWLDKTILQSLNDAVHQYPDKTALVSIKDDQPERTFTYRELLHTSNKIALGLRKLGIQKNDIVSCQLPNWWEFSLLYIACRRIGAVLNPLMPIFRERELTFMLKHSESKVFIVPKVFRKFDYEQLAYQLQKNINSLQHVIVIDGNGENNFADVLLNHGLDKDPQILNMLNNIKINADDIAQLIFTSGTTGEPKGVMHTANTLFANIVPYAERLHLNHEDVILMASPMAHQTGFMYGLIMPVILKAKVILQDIWDVDKAIDLIDKYKITFTMASTPFLNDLSNAASQGDKKCHSLKTFLCAGAPIPGPLVKKARDDLGVKVISAWGMTECGAVTMTRPEDNDERSFNTDGLPLPGVEIKIIDHDGKEKGINEPGSLMIRTCSNFGGYLKRPYLNATDHDDWFDTGDLAYQDEQGYIRICGRNKDVIIRGGENIPVAEIESLLYQHPDIAIVALVSYPDERLGERACAVIKLKEHRESIELSEIVDFLKQHKLAVQYIPERLEVWNEIPMTPSGKIQKFKLREMITSNS